MKDQGEHTCLAGHGKLEVYQYDIVSCETERSQTLKTSLGGKKSLVMTIQYYGKLCCSTKSLILQKCSFSLWER